MPMKSRRRQRLIRLFDAAFLDEEMNLQDVVLDDRTARTYDLEGGLDVLSDEGMVGRNQGDGANRGNTFGDNLPPFLDDDALIDDQSEAP